jgi:hypothetical protein
MWIVDVRQQERILPYNAEFYPEPATFAGTTLQLAQKVSAKWIKTHVDKIETHQELIRYMSQQYSIRADADKISQPLCFHNLHILR